MGRTRRAAIDGGFDQSGSDWGSNSGSFGSFPDAGYVQFNLGFAISLDSQNSISTVTLWSNGVLSLGPATQEQIDFFASGASAIPGVDGPGFPGEFFLFDYVEGTRNSFYSFGIGQADYNPPFNQSEAVQAAFFTSESGFQIIIDQGGFAILSEGGNFDAINAVYIGSYSVQYAGLEIEPPFGFQDFFTYFGTDDADNTVGSEFHETFYSSAGADLIDGKDGVDLVSYRYSGSSVAVNLATNANNGGEAAGDQLFNIERVEGSSFGDSLTGDNDGNELSGLAGADTIKGGTADDFIEGGAGADVLSGGLGVDTLSYYGSAAGVTVSLRDSTASGGDAEGDIFSGFERLNGSNFDDVLTSSKAGSSLSGFGGDDTLIGLGGNDSLSGGDGNDVLIGSTGADILDGSSGSDTASYTNSAAAVVISLEASTASGGEAAGDRLFSIENLVGTLFADNLTGDRSDNRLVGGAGADRLYGRSGNDVLIGDDGNDTLKGEAGIDVLVGGTGDDSLSGGDGSDIMAGDSGNDVFDGGAGADTMTGGVGDDVFYVDNPGDVVVEGAAEGTYDRVLSSVSYTLGRGAYVEELSTSKPTGTAAINLTGNELGNYIVGNAGNNVLDGAAGADTLEGGLGNDTYIVDNALDVVRESLNTGGIDTVIASVNFSLGKNVENVTLTGVAAINGSGNDLNNVLTGNGAANLLKGGAGTDTLYGGAGADTLNGGPDADKLLGGLGADTLLGGTGQDKFYFDSALGDTNVDTIADFVAVDDVIYLDRAIFGGLAAGTLSVDAFRLGTAAVDADDRIIYDSATGALWYDADGNGAGAAVHFADVTPGTTITNADFFVYV